MRTAKKIVGRGSPRFRFNEDDRRFIRFKVTRSGRVHTTRIFDLSESGISFMTAARLAPRVGDIIFMEFAPMGSVQLACQGRVVRIEEPSRTAKWNKFPDTVKVGVAFHDLPRTYQKLLVESLAGAFRRQQSLQRDRTLEGSAGSAVYSEADAWLAENAWSFVVAAAVMIVIGVAIYIYSEMPASEAPKTDAPWASNFFEKVVKPAK